MRKQAMQLAAQPTARRPARRSKRITRGVLALAVLLAAGGATAMWSTHAGATPDITSVIVMKQPFMRRVTAEGTMRAATGMTVVVPDTPGVWVPRKLVWLAPDGTAVKAGDPIARFDPSEAERQLRDAQADLDTADVRLRAQQLDTAMALANRDAEATLIKQDLEQKQLYQPKDPMVYSRNDIVDAAVEARLGAARHAQAEYASRTERRLAEANIQLLRIERQRTALALAHAKTALDNMIVQAPFDGLLVLHRDDHGDLPKFGATMSPNDPIAEMPVLDRMDAELFVLEVDAGGLVVDLPADVVVESRPDLTFHGKIRLVDKLAKPRQTGVPVSYISAIVALDKTDPDVMKPGQRVRATLVTDKLDALVVPRQAVFERAGKNVVYRRGAHGWEPVTVELGPATAGRIVVTAGLAEGDVVAERDPTRSIEPAIGSSTPSPEPTKGAP